MRLRLILCAQLWACQALAIEPGQGFAVQLEWPLVAQHVERAEPLDLQFRVEQCERFTTRVEHRSMADEGSAPNPWHSLQVDVLADGHGRYNAQVDVAKLLESSPGLIACWSDAERPLRREVRLAVTCDGGAREATSTAIPLVYGVAARAAPYLNSPGQQVHAVDANRLLVASAAGLHMVHLDRLALGPVPQESQRVGLGGGSLAMAHTATQAYVASDCLFPRCTQLTVEDPMAHARLTTESAELFVVDLQQPDSSPDGSYDDALISGMISVPGPVANLFVDRDDSLLVLSRGPYQKPDEGGLGHLGGWTRGVVISRVTRGKVRTEAVFSEAMLVGNAITATGLFMTEDDQGLQVRRLQQPHAGMPIKTEAGDFMHRVWPSPDGRHWFIGDRTREQICVAATGVCHPLQSSHGPETSWGHPPTWLSDGLARQVVTQELSCVEVFNLDGSLRGSTLGPSTELASDLAITPPLVALSGGRLAAVDGRHVRIFDRMGQPLGGTAFPTSCGSPFTKLLEMPGDRLAWISEGAMPAVYVLNLAELN